MVDRTVTQVAGRPAELPTVKALSPDEDRRERLRVLRQKLEGERRIQAVGYILTDVALLSADTFDSKFVEECADMIGGVLTADKTPTTLRVTAAKALGQVRGLKPLKYLEDALAAGKYPTTVRTAALRSVIWHQSLPAGRIGSPGDGQVMKPSSDSEGEKRMEIISAVAKGDKYDPGREAKRFLAEIEARKKEKEQ